MKRRKRRHREGMGEGFDRDELLGVPEIARYLKVSEVTVYRWCKQGRLPCLKLGHSWRVRRSALEDFLERGEHSATLFGQLRSFYRIPDNVLAIAQTKEMLFELDAAVFAVGEVRGGELVKFVSPETAMSVEEMRAELGNRGIEVERLEGEGRLRFVEEEQGVDHVEALRQVYREANGGHTLWASFNWVKRVDLEEAIERQRELTRFVLDRQLVVHTGVLEAETHEWPPPLGRKAQLVHSATVWLSEAGLATTRVAPVAEQQ
jgi:excisionase family DNA binding protein